MIIINNNRLNINGNKQIIFGDIVFELEFTEQTTFSFKLLANYHYDMIIHWGDGTKETKVYFDANGSTLDHVYQTGTYIVRINGVCETLDFSVGRNEPDNLINILSFGKTIIKHMSYKNCRKLKTLPNEHKKFTYITNMDSLFANCESLITIPQLDTSNVIIMSEMFAGCSSLKKIPLLNTSNVNSMFRMFNSCTSLISIPLLDTSNVTNMSGMFGVCASLTSIPLLNTSNVVDMSYMFGESALSIFPPLNTSNVTDMSNMFLQTKITTIPTLDTSNVINMYQMFSACNLLICLTDFDSSSILEDQEYVFYNCTSLIAPTLTKRNELTQVAHKGQWVNSGSC